MSEMGFQVIEVTNGLEGLNLLKKGSKFDVLLVDWEMPGMSGIEFIRKVRSDDANKETPIIMVSSRNARDNLMEAIEAGANEYIMKPFTKEILAMKLELLGVECQ
jgi:two-component system chemotaxis response regulator CheY